jgi:hypothetical protein
MDRKLNPVSLSEAVEVAQFVGPRAICMMNDYRERVLSMWSGVPIEGRPPRRPHRTSRAWDRDRR